jgi:WD40 repeat protein
LRIRWSRQNQASRHWAADVGLMAAVTLPDRRVVLATAHPAWSRVRLWNAVSGQSWGEPLEAEADVTALTVVIDAAGVERLAVGDRGGTVRIWDVEGGVEAAAPRPGHLGGVRSMVALPDACLGVAAHDGSVRVWRLADDGPPRIAKEPGYYSADIELRTVFASDGTTRTAFTYCYQYERVEDLTGEVRAGLWDPSAAMPSGHLLSDSHLWAAGGVDFAGWCDADGTVRLALVRVGIEVCDVRNGTLHRPSWDLGSLNKVEVFAGPDGTPWLAAGGNDGTVRLLDLATGLQARSPLFGHAGAIRAITAFRDPDGRPMLATGCDDGAVRIWDLTRAEEDTALPPTGHSGRVTVRTSPPVDGAPALVATYGEGDQSVRLWDQSTGESVGEPIEVEDRHYAFSLAATLVWVPLPEDDFGVACGTEAAGLGRWSAHTGRSVRWPRRVPLGRAPGRTKNAVMFTDQDGRHLLATVFSRSLHKSTVRLWDATTGRPLRRRGLPVRLRLPKSVHTFTAFTGPDGSSLIATGAADGIRLWNGVTGTRIGVPAAPPGTTRLPSRPRLLTAFPAEDGTVLLAAVGYTNDVHIWNPWTGGLVAEPNPGHTGKVHELVTLPGSPARLASGGEDGTLRIWEPLTGTVVGTLDTGEPIHDLAIGPAGTLFLAGPGGLSAVDLESRTDGEEPRPAPA